MARDAISRQYDVDKNSVTLVMEDAAGQYRPGTITFRAKEGKSINLDQIRESIKATRLSGGTQMRVTQLEVTAVGDVTTDQQEVVLKVKGTGQEFTLAEASDAGRKNAFAGLREALGRGEKVTSVTGRVEGWDGRFPDVLRALEKSSPSKRVRLLVTEFATAK